MAAQAAARADLFFDAGFFPLIGLVAAGFRLTARLCGAGREREGQADRRRDRSNALCGRGQARTRAGAYLSPNGGTHSIFHVAQWVGRWPGRAFFHLMQILAH
jgi:hypothetical protein